MSNSEPLGQYLDRDVDVCNSSKLYPRLDSNSLSHAVVLIWLSTAKELAAFRQHLPDLVEAAPLALSVAGTYAKQAFDELLHHLDTKKVLRQIMTKSTEGELRDCLEDLLWATWPSEDRFDNWSTYLVVGPEIEPLKSALADLIR